MKLPALRTGRSKDAVTVSTPYWEVTHDARQGWCVSSIVIRNGRNRNLLRGPVASSFCQFQTHVPDYPEFSDQFDRTARIEISASSREQISLRVTGTLADKKGKKAPVRYAHCYTYHSYGALTTTRRFVADKIPGISRISIGAMRLAGHLSEYCIRESYDDFMALPRRIWGTRFGVSFARWEKVNKNAQIVFNRYSIPAYLCFFERDMEGIDVFPGSQTHQWVVRSNGVNLCQRTALIYDAGSDTMALSLDPLFETLGREPAALQGEFAFTTVIGLPHKPKHLPSKLFHVGINSRSWPSGGTLKKWGKAGVGLVRLHDDGYHPASFWKDGSYPPYDPANMRKMDRVIRSAHQNGIKIIPYFSLLELHKDTPEFRGNWQAWRKVFAGSDEILFTQGQGEGFGGLMCLQSGWAACLKEQVKRILERHDFDGVYYDWCFGAMVCDHPGHAPGRHTMTEEMMDFVYWTRKYIGADKIMMIHQSLCPMIPVENMADAIITLEELTGDDYFLTALPHPSQLSPHCRFIGIAERQVCPSVIDQHTWAGKRVEGLSKAFLVRCALHNVFPYGDPNELAEYFAVRKTLSDYRFFDQESAPVETGNPNIPAVFYEGPKDRLVVLGNLSAWRESCRVRLRPDRANLIPPGAVITQILPGKCDGSKTAAALQTGMRAALAAHEIRVYRIS